MSSRIIVFVCRYLLNLYAFLNEENHNYYCQSDWIEQQLAAAEAAGKKVCVYPMHLSCAYTHCKRRVAVTLINNVRPLNGKLESCWMKDW